MKGIESTYLFEHGGMMAVIVSALLILIATVVISQVLVVVMYRTLRNRTGGAVSGSIIANVIRVCVWVAGISVLLNLCIGYNTSVLWGALGVGGIAISLGMQNTLQNLIGGLQVSLSRDLKLDDWITVGNITGQVKDITWRVMKIHDSSGNVYIVPNSVLNTTALCVMPPYQTISLPLVFSNMANIEDVQEKLPQIAYDALEESGYTFEEMRPELSIDGTGINSINATLAIYTGYEHLSMNIRECVIPPIVKYLKSVDAFAAYNS